MTKVGAMAMLETARQRLSDRSSIAIVVGSVALLFGLFVGTPVGRIISLTIVFGVAVYLYARWIMVKHRMHVSNWERQEDLYSHPPESQMKKLLFDDFQSSSGGKYVVKEIHEEESVVPSTKAAQPVALRSLEERVEEFQISDFFDLDSDIFRNEAEPRSEFNFLLSKALTALKDVLFAHSVAFFWANREKLQMVLEAKATESQNFMAGKRIPIEQDIVSQVARNGKPQILGRVNPVSEKELVRYYESAEYVKSLVVVPVYYFKRGQEDLPVGVIVADSKAEDAFGPETLSLLGNFTKLVSALIKSYTEKYDLLLDSELLTSIRRVQDRVKSDPSEYTILNSLAEEANRLLNWDCLGVVMYAEDKKGWVLQKVVNKSGEPYVTPDEAIDAEQSLVGAVIKSNKVEVVDDLGAGSACRFHGEERINLSGSFVCIPISSLNRCYGALTLESKNKFNFSGNEVETAYRLVENAAASLEVLYMNDLVKDFVIVDHHTGTLTKKHFLKKLEEEVVRADDFGVDLASVTIAVDGIEDHLARYGKDGFESIMNEVARLVRSNLRPYDVVGRQESDKLGVLLVNTAASDAYLWAEKLRKQIASHVITLGGRSFSVTLSAGVCGLTEGMHKEELLDGTSQVLVKAMENGGNLVRIF